MNWHALAVMVVGTAGMVAGCDQTPVPPVAIPRADDASAYKAPPQPKPLPPNGTIVGGVPQLANPAPPEQPTAGTGVPPSAPAAQPVEPITPAPEPALSQPIPPAPQQ